MKKANLFSLQVSVREDGKLAFEYDYIKPENFVKTLDDIYPNIRYIFHYKGYI